MILTQIQYFPNNSLRFLCFSLLCRFCQKVHLLTAFNLPYRAAAGGIPADGDRTSPRSYRIALAPQKSEAAFAPTRQQSPQNQQGFPFPVCRTERPFALATAMPSACRWRILVRSFSAIKDRTCNTMSLAVLWNFHDPIRQHHIEAIRVTFFHIHHLVQ